MDVTPKILIVDDEQDLREILQFNLSSEGFEVDTAASAEEALTKELQSYHLILLDVMMGGMSGYKMADMVRKEHHLDTPIIFLTAKTSENDLLTGFNVGGDDYIVKPFSIKEVIVRIKAVLKRGSASGQATTSLQHEDMLVDVDRKTVSIKEEAINLTRKEFEILALLLRNKGKFISRQDILDRIWSNDVIVTERNVDVNIARLRKKIGNYGSLIVGRSGYGYCFEM
ncbi:response regulator transcription factor [Mangrovibacterium marinum]|uniref:DNA-binding response OmpR family regulator n=1 Tax=Mangrovibacterium marinum TaxID=1639118 RepID=A0A2T5C2P0_9BACT|nr:response regulator transcription factor [Mangrovibacterium marinum]PTN08996.1 DNA-binding response OmpR family regulator [Mangrovibacterium marinum]